MTILRLLLMLSPGNKFTENRYKGNEAKRQRGNKAKSRRQMVGYKMIINKRGIKAKRHRGKEEVVEDWL
jgi:hypothetical protein